MPGDSPNTAASTSTADWLGAMLGSAAVARAELMVGASSLDAAAVRQCLLALVVICLSERVVALADALSLSDSLGCVC